MKLHRVVAFIWSVSIGLPQEQSPSDCQERYGKELAATPQSSLVHFQLGECLSKTKDRVSAVNQFREALNGDLQPPWTNVWSHINLGKIFDATGQRDRALNEYRMAEETKDNTRDAQKEVAKYRESPYRDH